MLLCVVKGKRQLISLTNKKRQHVFEMRLRILLMKKKPHYKFGDGYLTGNFPENLSSFLFNIIKPRETIFILFSRKARYLCVYKI